MSLALECTVIFGTLEDNSFNRVSLTVNWADIRLFNSKRNNNMKMKKRTFNNWQGKYIIIKSSFPKLFIYLFFFSFFYYYRFFFLYSLYALTYDLKFGFNLKTLRYALIVKIYRSNVCNQCPRNLSPLSWYFCLCKHEK